MHRCISWGSGAAFLLLTLTLTFAMLSSMSRFSRKVVAVLLAVWLPLFSGYALADSIVMQNMHSDCHGGQQIALSMQHDSASHQHMDHAKLVVNNHQSA